MAGMICIVIILSESDSLYTTNDWNIQSKTPKSCGMFVCWERVGEGEGRVDSADGTCGKRDTLIFGSRALAIMVISCIGIAYFVHIVQAAGKGHTVHRFFASAAEYLHVFASVFSMCLLMCMVVLFRASLCATTVSETACPGYGMFLVAFIVISELAAYLICVSKRENWECPGGYADLESIIQDDDEVGPPPQSDSIKAMKV